MGKNNKSFISDHYKNKVFLVYYCNHNKHIIKRKSDGPFKEQKDAYLIMKEYLANGVCAWIVSYNE